MPFVERSRESTPHARRWCTIALLLMPALATSACTDSGTTEPVVRIALSHVTDEVAASLTPDGQFILPSFAINPVDQVNESDARAIAARYVKDVAVFKAADWSSAYGSNIDPSALRPCDRALYAANPYVRLLGSNLSEITQRTFDAHWIVPMCGKGGGTQVVMAFSALATELSSALGTSKVMPWERSHAMSFGVPAIAASALFSPEGAAAHVFKKSGKRVASVPVLTMTPMPGSSVLVRWRMDIESPVLVRGEVSSARRQRSRLFVGFGDTFRSSGLLDFNPSETPAQIAWTDPITKSPFTTVHKAEAPQAVEIVTTVEP